MAGAAGHQFQAMADAAAHGGRLKMGAIALIGIVIAAIVVGGVILPRLGQEVSAPEVTPTPTPEVKATPTPIVTATPAPTATPTAVPTASMVPMKEETISFVLTNGTQVIVDVIGERVGYSKSSEFDGGFTQSVNWQKRQNHFDIVDLPGNWRIEIDWEHEEYRSPYQVPILEDFPHIPSVDGKAIAQGFGHIEFQ